MSTQLDHSPSALRRRGGPVGRERRSFFDWFSGRSLGWAERGWIPDPLLRRSIRRLLAERVGEQTGGNPARRSAAQRDFVAATRSGPIAPLPEKANEQHYEVPAAFFEHVLGPRLKYSACLYAVGAATLAEAEEAMLAASCERAALEDGMRVLDLGCGWGSLSLWIAERFRHCDVLAVSNSTTQTEWIRRRCDERGLHRVRVVTGDINDFDPGARFDRVVSVEMFEHMRNWELLLRRIASWLTPRGRLFAHFFCHREAAYPFVAVGRSDWIATRFFSGGMMPSDGWIFEFQDDLRVEALWRVSGLHYHRTCEAWLANLDAQRGAVRAALAAGSGEAPAELQLWRWRLFFLACSELFRYRSGQEWRVLQVRLAPRGES